MSTPLAATSYKYEMVVDELKKFITDGIYTRRLPSVRAMAREFGVDARTILKAVEQLERERLVFTDSTRGINIRSPGEPRPRSGIVNIVHPFIGDAGGPENDLLLKSLHGALSREGCRMVVTMQCGQTMNDPRYWADDSADGYLFVYGNEARNLEPHQILTRIGRPMVYTSRVFGADLAYDWVEFDHVAALDALYKRLLRAGHRRIAYVEIEKAAYGFRLRDEQYLRFMADHALDFPQYRCIAPPGADAARQTNAVVWARYAADSARRLLAADRPPTAVILMELPPEPVIELFAGAGLELGRDYIVIVKRSVAGEFDRDGRFPAMYSDYDEVAKTAVRRLRAVMETPTLPHEGTLVPVVCEFDGITRLPAGAVGN